MRSLCLALLATAAMTPAGLAAPPDQFRVWGAAGPEFAATPEGWSEAPNAPEGLPQFMPTPEEQQRGYVLFARDPFAPIFPDSRPAPTERADELGSFCAQGEYEPLSFAIHSLETLQDVTVEVTELRSEAGAVIPRDHIDVRIVRCVRVVADANAKTYRLHPFLLEKRDRFAVPAGQSLQVWLTVKAPEGARAGQYGGTVSVAPEGRAPAELGLRLEVLPFALPPAPIEMAVFAPRPAASDELLRQELTDLREHGMTAIQPAPGVEIASRDRSLGEDDVAATRARCQRIMGAVEETCGGWRFPVTFEVGHQIASYWDPGRNWFVFWPHSPEIEADFIKAIQVVTGLAEAEGWPPLRVYALDEAGAHGLLDEAAYYYGLIKQHFPDLTTWTTIGGGIAMGHDEIGQLSPVVDWFSTNRFTPEIAQALAARNKPFGIYNGAGSTPAGARFFFGFYGWKTAAHEVSQWVYSFGDAVFEGNGMRADDEGYVYHAPDGPLPSLMWEAAREGVDDYRYTELLWQMIGAAKASGDSVAEAEEAVRSMMAKVPWTFQALQGGDRTPPPHPSALRKWRRRVADQILALRADAHQEGRPVNRASAASRSPFDFAWATSAEETVAYGEELLPPSDFEADMGPWRAEAWNGKGTGELDATVAHSGKQSVRIDVPPDSGNEGVTVLVWPTWGGSKLDLRLQGDRTYELSAWVKLRGRNTLPDLRISLPADAERKGASGRGETDADGWQQIRKRTTLSFPASPTYLAVWVQGPGTVWIDDLSLREVFLPPVEIELDQDEYDGADKIGVATVRIARRVSPAKVRLTLSRDGRQPIAELTVPFQPQPAVASVPAVPGGALTLVAPATLNTCRLVFEPSGLASGTYETRVEILGAGGRPAAEARASFERLE